jgi:hypothetical protein
VLDAMKKQCERVMTLETACGGLIRNVKELQKKVAAITLRTLLGETPGRVVDVNACGC